MAGGGVLYYGDNLDVLRAKIADESVDLIYLDPPFNSNAHYNVLFRTPTGEAAEAQAEAFHDTWRWGPSTESAYDEILSSDSSVARILRALRSFLGESDMMAYLTMMAVRLLELHRVLKPTGSLYLHCDPTASHYLKVVLDQVFGPQQFLNEITWKRSTSHGNVGRNYGSLADVLLFYTKSSRYTWNQQYTKFAEAYVDSKFRYSDPDGRRWQSVTLRNPGKRPNLFFPFRASNGYTYKPHLNGWSCNLERLRQYDAEGRLHFPSRAGGQLRLKMYLDESPGVRLQNIWDDIPAVNSQARERIGYPTQKPLALMERILAASSNPDDVVLDPFCGCGTTVHAAQMLGRKWIGIDVTHYAITVIENRLKAASPDLDEIPVIGRPRDLAGARDLARRDKYQFQWWANWLVGVQAFESGKKGADRGIDGTIFFKNGPKGTGRILVSVKGGDNVSVPMIRDLRGTIEREEADLGLFVTLAAPTSKMRAEAAAAGLVKTAHGSFPRLQITTVEDLLQGRRPSMPPAYQIETDARPRARATPKRSAQMEFSFLLQGGKSKGKAPHRGEVHLDPALQQQLLGGT